MGICEGFKKFLKDNIRSLAISCLGISASGWLTFVVAFASQLISLDPIINAISFLFVPWYFAAAAGPILYVLVGVYMLVGSYVKYAKIFKSVAIFCIIVYVAALASPMFFVATLFASAAAGIDEAVDAIDINIPSIDLGNTNLGPLNPVRDALESAVNAATDIIIGLLRGVLYFILIILFDLFVSGIKGQFIGGFTSIFFLCVHVMLWPFIKFENKGNRKKLC